MADRLTTVHLDDIHDSPDNLRAEVGDVTDLANSIAFIGLLEPLRVQKNGDGYKVIAGHRRLAALKMLHASGQIDPETKVIIGAQLDDTERTAAMLIENMQRVNLAPKEEAEGVRRLVQDYGMSQADIATNLGVTKQWVTDRVAMLNVPEYIFTTPVHHGSDKTLPVSHIAMLGKLPEDVRNRLCKDDKVPSQYDIEDRTSKVKAMESAEKLMAKLRKDKVLAVTEAELKKLIGKSDLSDLGGDDLVIAGQFTQATKVEVSHYWGKPDKPTVLLEEIMSYKLSDYEWDRSKVYVLKKVSGFPKWFTATMFIPSKKEQNAQAEREAQQRAAQEAEQEWKQQFAAACHDFITQLKTSELIAHILVSTLGSLTQPGPILTLLGEPVAEPVYDGIDMSKAMNYGSEEAKKKREADTAARQLNAETLDAYANKNSANLARAAAASMLANNTRRAEDWGIEVPRHPLDNDDYDDEGDDF